MKPLPFILALLLAPAANAHPDPAHSLAEIDRHLIETPDDLILLLRKGELLLRGGQPDLAMNVASEGLRKSPRDPGLLLLNARILESSGDRKAAFEQVSSITRGHPSFPDAWSELARLHHDARRHDEAIAAKLRHLETDPHPGPGDFLSISNWLVDRRNPGDIDAAITVLNRGIASFPALTGLQHAAIQLESLAGRFDAALSRIDQLVFKNRPSVRYSLLRADILETAGRHEEAAAACDSALALFELSPSNGDESMRQKISARKKDNLDRVSAPSSPATRGLQK